MKTSAVCRAVVFLALALLPAALFSQAPQAPAPLPAPTNLDFEQGQPGEEPPGWHNSTYAKNNGYTAKIVSDKPESGRQAVLVALEGERKDANAFGNLLTFFDATPYRGKRVRFRAAVRTEVSAGDSAALWLRVDREGEAMGFFDNMADRHIRSSEWKTYEITGEVAPDAKTIFLGMMLFGDGKAWMDSASFEVLGAAEVRHEPARPLEGRGLENLTAFARLFGYVRYFHPSDQAAAADWEALALAGVQAAEPAKSPEELAKILGDFCRPLAPTVRVYPTAGPRPALPAELKARAGTEAVHWEHLGVQFSTQNIYKSERVSGARAPEGAQVAQVVEAAPYRGKRVTVRGVMRGEVPADAPAVLRLKVYAKGTEKPTTLAEVKPAVAAKDWQPVEISGEVPADAEGLEIDLGLTGGGSAGWDDLSLQVAGGPGAAADPLGNPDFEIAGYDGAPAGWELPRDARRTGYHEALSTDRPKSGKGFLLLSWTKPDPSTDPQPYEPLVADLGGGVSALVPLALYKDAQGTLPHAAMPAKTEAGPTPSGNDRTGGPRKAFAHLPLLWDWVEGQLVVTQVASAGAGGLRPGDVIVSLNGRPAGEALASTEELVSGATPQWRRWVALNRLPLGEEKEEVRIEARHPDGTAVTAILAHTVPAYRDGSLVETRPAKISEPRPGILYVNIDQVTEDDFKGAVDRLAAAKGIVFDLRGYPGKISPIILNHLIDHPFTSARWNVPVITRPDGQGWGWDVSGWFEQPAAPRFPGKIAFITDGRAISYAESYMGIVEAYHLGEIVGGPTAGTNGNINPFTLPGGYRVVWTGMKVTKHDGSRHHGVGIQPTVPVVRTIQGVAAGRDELLEKAIEVVSR